MEPNTDTTARPRLLITMGDVAGIGPEIIAHAWTQLVELSRPVVIGDPEWLRRSLSLRHIVAEVHETTHPSAAHPTPTQIPCIRATEQQLRSVQFGRITASGGRAAYDFLCAAIDWTVAGEADAIVTAPLHKEGLHAAGLPFPGHTEILAERTGTSTFAMVLECNGLAVAHVTLHMALREVFDHISEENVLDKILLLDRLQTALLGRRPRIGVAALNPHASDGGLFGREEATILAPAIKKAQRQGTHATGPWPSDTLFVRARDGEFDGVTAMYHDQGHIAMKLLGGRRAVNISAGLPIIRTSVAHGTAYDIAGRGIADSSSLVEACKVAAKLAMRGAK